jgi:hypothetical protein
VVTADRQVHEEPPVALWVEKAVFSANGWGDPFRSLRITMPLILVNCNASADKPHSNGGIPFCGVNPAVYSAAPQCTGPAPNISTTGLKIDASRTDKATKMRSRPSEPIAKRGQGRKRTTIQPTSKGALN